MVAKVGSRRGCITQLPRGDGWYVMTAQRPGVLADWRDATGAMPRPGGVIEYLTV
jgi:hypothetical protein